MKTKIILAVAASCIFLATQLVAQQLQGRLENEKGEYLYPLVAHPLSWWTKDPLRLDTSGDLMLGFMTSNGQPVTAKDYETTEQVLPLGELSGHRIVQVLTTIKAGRRVIAAGFASDDGKDGEWKDLLVSSGMGGSFVDLYALHFDLGELVKKTSARIYGSGPDAILGTYDPDTGNGGGCLDGYWWFDQAGVHEVDFSPLTQAVSRALPANATFTSRCWALDPEKSELNSWVQKNDATCHACGGLGEVHARYRIEHGIAKPVSVRFDPAPQN